MSFVVVYDASVLYPGTLRDLLIRIAQTGMVQARWTEQILDEVFGSLRRNRPDLDPDRLARTRRLMSQAVRDCLVSGYEPLVEAVKLPDPEDRHVLGAVWRCVQQIADSWRDPPGAASDVLDRLLRCGLVQSVATLQATSRLIPP